MQYIYICFIYNLGDFFEWVILKLSLPSDFEFNDKLTSKRKRLERKMADSSAIMPMASSRSGKRAGLVNITTSVKSTSGIRSVSPTGGSSRGGGGGTSSGGGGGGCAGAGGMSRGRANSSFHRGSSRDSISSAGSDGGGGGGGGSDGGGGSGSGSRLVAAAEVECEFYVYMVRLKNLSATASALDVACFKGQLIG